MFICFFLLSHCLAFLSHGSAGSAFVLQAHKRKKRGMNLWHYNNKHTARGVKGVAYTAKGGVAASQMFVDDAVMKVGVARQRRAGGYFPLPAQRGGAGGGGRNQLLHGIRHSHGLVADAHRPPDRRHARSRGGRWGAGP